MKICSLYKPTLGVSQPLRQRSQQRRQKDSTVPTEREAGKRAISRLAGEGRSRGGDSQSPLGHGPRGSGQSQRGGQLNRARQASSIDSKAVGTAGTQSTDPQISVQRSKSFLKFSTSTLDLISLFFNLGFSYDRMFITKDVPLYSWSAASAASHLLNVLILLLVYN